MHEKDFMIAIVGNGKFTQALVSGLLRKFKPSQIALIVRQESQSDHWWFTQHGIEVTKDMGRIASATHICLMVTPIGSGSILSRLNQAGLIPGDRNGYEIISMVSALRVKKIKNAIPAGVITRIICATGNTNIATGTGIICATQESRILKGLGIFILEKEWQVRKSISTVGSMNALWYRILQLSYSQSPLSLYDWLLKIQQLVLNFNFEQPINFHDPYSPILTSIHSLSEILYLRLEYSSLDARVRIIQTLVSCIETLLARGQNVSEEDIITLMKTVITPGGSTEKGVYNIRSLDDLLDKNKLYLWTDVVCPIYEASNNFETVVESSIAEAQLFEQKVL